jgi:hypothetical protein
MDGPIANVISNKFVESFNPTVLSNIVRHKEFYNQYLEDDEQVNPGYVCNTQSPLCLAEKYLKSAVGDFSDKVVVEYERKYNRGRRFACGALSLQSLPRLVRGSIASEFYYDVDMVNCHPCIIEQLFKGSKISTMFLSNYISNRDEIINDICENNPGVEKGTAKNCILSILYGGNELFNSLACPTDWLKGYKNEIAEIHKRVPELYRDEYELQKKIKGDDYYNLVGSTLSATVCVIEDKLLEVMLDYFVDAGVVSDDVVLCFDGIMICKERLSTKKLATHLANIKKLFAKEEGYVMDLKVKDFVMLPTEIPEEYRIVEPELEIKDIKALYRETDYYWFDFIKEMNTIHDSLDSLKSAFKEKIRKCMLLVHEMSDTFIKKISKDNTFHYDKTVPDATFTYKVAKKNKVSTKTITFKKLLKDGLQMEIPAYNKLDFRPYGPFETVEEDERSFNTFTGLKAQLIPEEEIDMSKIDIILNHIKAVWCDDNEEQYKWVLSWFKVIFTNPRLKTKVAIVLKSTEQQIGKGMIINHFLIPLVFGEEYALSVASMDTLVSKFNQILMNRLFINIDELSTLEGGFHQSFDVMKKRITDNTIKIEIKGGRVFIYPDYSNVLGCTQHEFTVKIEAGDCRWAIFECSPRYKGNYPYFNKVRKSLTEEAANHFYSYICYYRDSVEVRNIPKTQLKQDMMIMSLQSPVRFIMHLKDIHDPEATDDGAYATALYSSYKDWCTKCTEKAVSSTQFGRAIKSLIQKKRTSVGIKYFASTIDLSSLGL